MLHANNSSHGNKPKLSQTELNLTSAPDQAIVHSGATWPDAFIHIFDSLALICGSLCAFVIILVGFIFAFVVFVKVVSTSGMRAVVVFLIILSKLRLSLTLSGESIVEIKPDSKIDENIKSKKNRQRQKDRIS